MHYKLLTIVLVLVPTALADDWPNWMGPRLDGVSTEIGWAASWPTTGLKQKWTKELGIGFSSVSVVDGLLYSMGHAKGEETIWCLNESTGKTVWSHSYPAELNANLYEGGPGATPTIDGDHVYSLSVDGQLICLQRKTGDIVWQTSLQEDFEVGLHEWGFNSSPLIVGNRLYVQGGRIATYDKMTGEQIWQTEKHAAGYGAIRTFQHNNRNLLASLDCDGLRISDVKNGAQVAFAAWKSPFRTNSTTPIIVGNKIYISTGYNVGCGLFQFDGTELQPLYSSKRMRNHFNNSILHDGFLYGMDGNSNLGRVVTLTCMDFETGEVQWKQRGMGCGSLMIADGKLLILTEDGDLVLADANSKSFKEISRSKFLTGRCWTVPVLANGKIFGRNASGKLVCAELPTVD